MTRREAAEEVFQYIRNKGFQPENIQYGDGYFIIDMGKDSVVHFDIKGIRGWRFAMWLETDSEKLTDANGKSLPVIRFFCQHELNIDKFKPSCSFFLQEYNMSYIEQPWGGKYYAVMDIIRMIKRHPIISFCMDANESAYYDKSYILRYLEIVSRRMKHRVKEWCRDTSTALWHGFKVRFVNRYDVVETVELKDGNRDGWISYPRYEMIIRFKKISDDETEQDDAELRVINRWFKKGYYRNMNLLLFREGEDKLYSYA